MLEMLSQFLLDRNRSFQSGDKRQVYCMCPRCDSESTSRPHLSVLVDPEPTEGIKFNCFRASCLWKGAITTKILKNDFECSDPAVLDEVAQHNLNVNPYLEKDFDVRESREYAIVNLPVGNNKAKMRYIQNRLGVKLQYEQLKDLKIQLSLFDMLRINDIKKLAAGEGTSKMQDVYGVGFVSMFNDYLIVRDITPDNKTGRRYYNYSIAGKKDKGDIKLYCIPKNINLLDPRSAVINVAEGPFSILGAYLNTDLGGERKNNLWLACCGAQYESVIMRACKQFGLLKVRIHIWSDSEIKLAQYQKLYSKINDRLDIRAFFVHYNEKAEDFGHRKSDIKINTIKLKGE